MTDDEFWSATDQLNLIHQWARARYVAPWALLLAVLARVAASTGPHVMLPGPPAPASLNMAIVLMGRSGAGKGVTDKLSCAVWPADIHEEALGSGQGISELFKEPKNPDDERVTRALFKVSEIDHLAALNAGKENNTRATLKAGLTGDRLGSKGATAATSRLVPADSYRLVLSISAQYGHTAVLLDDVSGGTPQRMVWGPVTDPAIPETPGPEPDHPLNSSLPSWATSGQQVLIEYGTPAISKYVAAGLLANQRGEVDAIDGHRTLTRLKVAAQLAIMCHRPKITELDWHLSEVIMAKSDATRAAVLEYDRQAQRAKVHDRAIARAVGDEVYDNRLLDGVKRSILRTLERDGEQAGNVLRSRMGKRDRRDMFDQAIALLEHEGLVVSIVVERGTRYRLSGVQGEPPVQGPSAQVTRGERPVQGELEATVTDLDSRRSLDLHQPKLSCAKWFDNYVIQRRAASETTITSFAVKAAAATEGYSENLLHQAIANHPDVHMLDRTGGNPTWSITGEPTGYQSVLSWFNDWLDTLPATMVEIDKAALKQDCEAAGHSWESLRREVVQRCPRIDSVKNGRATVWRIVTTEETSA